MANLKSTQVTGTLSSTGAMYVQEFEVFHEGNLDVDGKITIAIDSAIDYFEFNIDEVEQSLAALQDLVNYTIASDGALFDEIQNEIITIQQGVDAEIVRIDGIIQDVSDLTSDLSNLTDITNTIIEDANETKTDTRELYLLNKELSDSNEDSLLKLANFEVNNALFRLDVQNTNLSFARAFDELKIAVSDKGSLAQQIKNLESFTQVESVRLTANVSQITSSVTTLDLSLAKIETELSARIDDEESYRIAEISRVDQAFTDFNITFVQTTESLQAQINDETSYRVAEISNLNTAIIYNGEAITQVENSLTAQINDETNYRIADISSLQTALTYTNQAIVQVENNLLAQISDETSYRIAAIDSLDLAITGPDGAISQSEDNVLAIVAGEYATIANVNTLEQSVADSEQALASTQTEVVANRSLFNQGNSQLNSALIQQALSEVDIALYRLGAGSDGLRFARAIDELVALTNDDGAITRRINDQESIIQDLGTTLNSRININQTTIASVDQALAQSVITLNASIDDAEAFAVDQIDARVGYCDIGGSPSGAETPEQCALDGGTWIPSTLSQAVRTVSVTTGSGSTASVSQIAQTYEEVNGTLIARGGILTDVNGNVSGFINTNNGQSSSFDILANVFRVGTLNGSTFEPSLTLNTGTNRLEFDGDIVAGSSISSPVITGGTITGGILRTATSGYRVELGNTNYPMWYGTGTVNEVNSLFYVSDIGKVVVKSGKFFVEDVNDTNNTTILSVVDGALKAPKAEFTDLTVTNNLSINSAVVSQGFTVTSASNFVIPAGTITESFLSQSLRERLVLIDPSTVTSGGGSAEVTRSLVVGTSVSADSIEGSGSQPTSIDLRISGNDSGTSPTEPTGITAPTVVFKMYRGTTLMTIPQAVLDANASLSATANPSEYTYTGTASKFNFTDEDPSAPSGWSWYVSLALSISFEPLGSPFTGLEDFSIEVVSLSGTIPPNGTIGIDIFEAVTSSDGFYVSTNWDAVTNKPSPVITFDGDVTGSVTLTEVTSGTATITVNDNSHSHTIANVSGLQTALDNKVETSLLGAVNGVATLDAGGKVPSSQLPAFVDDILEYANFASFPVTGDSTKLYVAIDTGTVYRWSGSQYIDITSASSADEATRLSTARLISLSGDATGSVSFDGTQNVDISVVIADDSHNHIIANVDGLQTALDGKVSKAGDTMTGNLIMGGNYIDFATGGSDQLAQLRGIRTNTDLNTRYFDTESGFSYTSFNAVAANRPPSTISNNANGLITINTHTGAYNHQLAFTNQGALWHRSKEVSTLRPWERIFDDGYHPNADTWTTARNLTIGNTAKSVDGSANVSWSLAEIGAQAAGNYVTTDTTQTITGSKTFSGGAQFGESSRVGVAGDGIKVRSNAIGSGYNNAAISVIGSGGDFYPLSFSNGANTEAFGFLQITSSATSYLALGHYEAGNTALVQFFANSTTQFNGSVSATTFSGDGASITGLSASNLSSGTVPSGRLSGTYAIDISGNAATATTATNSNQLGGVAASGYLRSDAADTASGLITFTGGINTNSAIIGSDAAVYDLVIGSDAPILRFEDSTSTTVHSLVSNNSEFRVQAHSSMSLYTNGTRGMYIDSSQNIAIGNVTSAAAKLHLATDGDRIRIESSTAGRHMELYSNNDANVSNNTGGVNLISTIQQFHLGGGEDSYILTGIYDFGIGTASPSEKLHVSGGDIAIDAVGAGNTASLKFINDNERCRITSNYDSGGGGRLAFWTDTTGGVLLERMTIKNDGDVGIGTNTPTEKLEVVGNIKAQNLILDGIDVGSELATEEATLATTTQTLIASFSTTTYGGAKLLIQAKSGTERHMTEVLVVHNGSVAEATEYATIVTDGSLFTIEVDISAGNVRVLATSASAVSTEYKVFKTMMKA